MTTVSSWHCTLAQRARGERLLSPGQHWRHFPGPLPSLSLQSPLAGHKEAPAQFVLIDQLSPLPRRSLAPRVHTGPDLPRFASAVDRFHFRHLPDPPPLRVHPLGRLTKIKVVLGSLQALNLNAGPSLRAHPNGPNELVCGWLQLLILVHTACF